MYICGKPVYANTHLAVHRTWQARLFSRPWRPWVAREPNPDIISTPSAFFAHPVVIDRLKKAGMILDEIPQLGATPQTEDG